MPLFVTDDDVLQQIGLDDDAAAVVQAQIAALGPKAPASTSAAWAVDLLAYRTWAGAAKARLSGGFFSGEWLGVVADGNAAIAWRDRIATYQSIVNAVAQGQTPAQLVPAPSSVADVSDTNTQGMVTGATGAVASVTGAVAEPLKWIAIAAVAAAIAFLVIEKRT